MIDIRRLATSDTQIFFQLRLEALQNEPANFQSSYEDEKENGRTFYKNLLANSDLKNVILGAFKDHELVGLVGILQEPLIKIQHKCTIWGMYVHHDYRGQGIAKALIIEALEHAKQIECQIVNLTVKATNSSAQKLYESFGFKAWGVEPKAMQVNGNFYDDVHMGLILPE